MKKKYKKHRKNEKVEKESKYDGMLSDELISEYAREYQLEREVAKRIVESVFETARFILVKNSELYIRGFGRFLIGIMKGCRYKNNYSGKIEDVPMVKRVRFRPARGLKMTINEKAKDELFRHSKRQKTIKRKLIQLGFLEED